MQRSIQAVNTGPCRCCPACAFCRSPTGAGGVRPISIFANGMPYVYATLSGYNFATFAGFPSVYDDWLARVAAPLPWNSIDGSYLLGGSDPGTIRVGGFNPSVNRPGGFSLFVSQYNNGYDPDAATLAVLKAIYDSETAGCGYTGAFPTVAAYPERLDASITTTLNVRVECPVDSYGGPRSLPVSVELSVQSVVSVQTKANPADDFFHFVDVSRTVAYKSLLYVPLLTGIDCVNRVLQVNTATSSGQADRLLSVKLRGESTCRDTNTPAAVPYPGTLTVTW